MGKKLKDWVIRFAENDRVSGLACMSGKNEALYSSSMMDDEEYYVSVVNPTNMLWGISYRQPEISLNALSNIAKSIVSLNGVDRKIVDAFDVSVNGGEDDVLSSTFLSVSKLKYGPHCNMGVDRIAYRFIRWRRGEMKAIKAAEGIREGLLFYARERCIGFDFLKKLRKEIPFDLWEQGIVL